ncbi:MAG: hypothetical protein ABUL72_03285 [Armatimonadota bacterium]
MGRKLLLGLLLLVSAFAHAQFDGVKVEIFADGKEDASVPGGFSRSNPLNDPVEIEYKGPQKNFWWRISWTAPLEKATAAKVVVLDEKGTFADGFDPKGIAAGRKMIESQMTLTAGSYTVKLVDSEDDTKVFAERKFKVVDNVGERATGNQPAGKAEFWVCKTVNDDWMPVEFHGNQKDKVFTWAPNTPFEVLIKNNKVPFGVSFLGIVIHKQGDDGKDVDFVNEFMTEELDEKKATMWCTVGGLPNMNGLPVGKYTIYMIDWANREVNFHNGNLKKYFSKATLIVKDPS